MGVTVCWSPIPFDLVWLMICIVAHIVVIDLSWGVGKSWCRNYYKQELFTGTEKSSRDRHGKQSCKYSRLFCICFIATVPNRISLELRMSG